MLTSAKEMPFQKAIKNVVIKNTNLPYRINFTKKQIYSSEFFILLFILWLIFLFQLEKKKAAFPSSYNNLGKINFVKSFYCSNIWNKQTYFLDCSNN